MDNKSIIAISEESESIGVVYEPMGITSAPENIFQAVTGPKVDLDSTLYTSFFGISHNHFLCKSRRFAATCETGDDGVYGIHIFLHYCINSEVALNATQWSSAFFLAPQYSRIRCQLDWSSSSMKISLSTYFSYAFPHRWIFATISSAYCDQFVTAASLNQMLADSVLVTISSIAYFSSRKFTTCG